MTMQLYLKFGTDTVDFQADGCVVTDGYYPQTPGAGEERATEKFECFFIGTAAAAKALINKANRWFEIAREYALDNSPYKAMWMYFAVDRVETVYRARVYDGNVLLNNSLDHAWRKGRVKFSVVLERDPFWEAEDWVSVPLSNLNGTDVTTGLRVYACGDGSGTSPNKKVYYTWINAVDVEGDLPGPAKLCMTLEATAINGLYIGQLVDRDGWGLLDVHKETDNFTGGTKIANSGCSGGYYKALTIPTSWDFVLYYSLFTIASYPKRYFRFIGRFKDAPPAGTWVKIQLRSYAGLLAETAAVRLSTRVMQDLGVMQLPPYQQILEDAYTLTFRLYAYNAGGGTLNLDCLMLMGQDGYAELGRDDTSEIVYESEICEQWGERKSYINVYNAYTFFNKNFGNGIWLVPGSDQTLYFLMYNDTAAPITTSMLVQCWHKPRKRAI